MHVGTTLDQVARRNTSARTRRCRRSNSPSKKSRLSCGSGYGCAYFNTISWRTPTMPLPMENSPQVVFEKLFGDGSNAAQRLAREAAGPQHSRFGHATRSARLQSRLDPSDRARLGEYLDDIREIERRIQKAEQQIGERSERSRSAGRHARSRSRIISS